MRKKYLQNTGPTLPGIEISEALEDTTSRPLTCLPEASLVNLIALQGNEKQAETAVICGGSFTVSFAILGHTMCWLKMYQDCFQVSMDGSLELFLETWPKQAMMQNGVCYRQRSSERHTSEKECSLLPTPLATDATHGGPNARDSKGRYALSGAVHHLLPTPTAMNHTLPRNPASIERQVQKNHLNGVVAMWHTPAATDHKRYSRNLEYFKQREAEGYHSLAYDLAFSEGPTPEGTYGQLNPDWVEWLMGFPIGWTDLEDSETL